MFTVWSNMFLIYAFMKLGDSLLCAMVGGFRYRRHSANSILQRATTGAYRCDLTEWFCDAKSFVLQL